MAFKLTRDIQTFQALSTDERPSSPPEGSTLHLVDTGEQFVYFDGAWELDLRAARAIKQAETLP